MKSRAIDDRHLALLVSSFSVLLLSLLIGLDLGAASSLVDRLDRDLFILLRGDGRPPGPAELVEAIRDVTALGSFTGVGIVLVVGCAALTSAGRRRDAAFAAITIVTGIVATLLLKELIARPRPDFGAGGPYVATLSFPSGHAAKGALTFGAFAVVFYRLAGARTLRVTIVTLAVILVLAVGLSRVYLGVHWPSDVIGGWLLGLAWVLGAWLLAERADQSGQWSAQGRATPPSDPAAPPLPRSQR